MEETKQTLYQHRKHAHTPKNAVAARKARQQGANARLAVWLTQHVGSMTCAYLFAAIGIGSLVGVFTGNTFLALLFGSISSYFLQLVLLPIISVGTNVLNEQNELMAEEAFQTTMHSFHDIEGIMEHLSQQDAELLKHSQMLEALLSQQQSPSRKRTKPARQTDG